MRKMAELLGLDIGTSGAKAVVINERGEVIRQAHVGYGISMPRPNWSEQDPSSWWDATERVLAEVDSDQVAAIGLTGQMQRAAISIPSNIAEGAERGSAKDFAHFLNIAKGSCGELRTQVYIARKLDLLPKASFDRTVTESKELSSMLEGLRRSMLKRVPQKRPT